MTQVFLVPGEHQGFKISWSECARLTNCGLDRVAGTPVPLQSPSAVQTPALIWKACQPLTCLCLCSRSSRVVFTLCSWCLLGNADPAMTCHWAPPVHLRLLRALVLGSKTKPSCLFCHPLSPVALIPAFPWPCFWLCALCMFPGHVCLPQSALASFRSELPHPWKLPRP